MSLCGVSERRAARETVEIFGGLLWHTLIGWLINHVADLGNFEVKVHHRKTGGHPHPGNVYFGLHRLPYISAAREKGYIE